MTSRRPQFEVDVVGPELHIVDDEISDDFDAETAAATEAAAGQQKSFGRELYDTAVRSGRSSLKLVVRYAPYVVAMLALYALISHKIESDRRNRLAFDADLDVNTRARKSSVKRARRKYDRQTDEPIGSADASVSGAAAADEDRDRFGTSSSQNRDSARASRRDFD